MSHLAQGAPSPGSQKPGTPRFLLPCRCINTQGHKTPARRTSPGHQPCGEDTLLQQRAQRFHAQRHTTLPQLLGRGGTVLSHVLCVTRTPGMWLQGTEVLREGPCAVSAAPGPGPSGTARGAAGRSPTMEPQTLPAPQPRQPRMNPGSAALGFCNHVLRAVCTFSLPQFVPPAPPGLSESLLPP